MYDPITAAEERIDREEDAEQAVTDRRRLNFAAIMTDALLRNPLEIVETPAYRYNGGHTAVHEAMSNLSDENALDLCRLLALCDRSAEVGIRVLAQAIVARISKQYSDTHADAA